MKKFNIKDLGEVKTIIEWEIIQDLASNILNIDEKVYIQDLLQSKEKIFCNSTVFLVKARFTFFLDQVGNHQ